MWRSKKFIVTALLAVVVLVGSIGGVVFAQTENGDDSQPKTLLARVAEKLGINQQELEDAFAEAQSEMRDEALDSRLQKLVDEGKIDPDQAVQYKAWLQAKPDMEQFRQQLQEWQQARPDIPPELKEWQQAGPDIPLLKPFSRGFGFRGFRGGPCGWGGLRALPHSQ